MNDDLKNHSLTIGMYSDFCRKRLKTYEAILQQAGPVLKNMRNEETLRPPHFNIFFALGHAYREVSTHSAMLSHLLDPAGGHAQGSLFLRTFLRILEQAALRQERQVSICPPRLDSRWRCSKEVRLPEGLGQADILLRGPDTLIVIENKIFAGDMSNQLARYWRFAKAEQPFTPPWRVASVRLVERAEVGRAAASLKCHRE